MTVGRVERPNERSRVMFLYWGRRGALSQFTLELGRAAMAEPNLQATISVSRQNESFDAFREFGDALSPVSTFSSNIGALTGAWRVPLLRRQLVERLKRDRTQAVIALMPHVWTPLVVPAIRRAGVRYVTMIHDADGHVGDPTSLVHGWGLRDVLHADLVLTLSLAVAGRLEATDCVPRAKICTLFHPDLTYGPPAKPRPPQPGEPFRLLFLGRIIPYKGLAVLLDAVDILKEAGLPVELGVFGEGLLGSSAKRLKKIGAEVVNRWLTADEIGAVIPRFHAVVLSHIEASQSGVAAAALGSGVPIISTPVGGLPEQVLHGQTGIVAAHADAQSLAVAVRQLYRDPQLYELISRQIDATREQRSMQRFVADVVSHALHAGSGK